MKTILIINGPNLNMLGRREPEIYGSTTLADIEAMCVDKAEQLDVKVICKQSNHEGEIVEMIQAAMDNCDGIVINPAAYTHTSVAIHDALKMTGLPIAEVHLSNPLEREEFRHISYVEPLAKLRVCGKGADGYNEALEQLVGIL